MRSTGISFLALLIVALVAVGCGEEESAEQPAEQSVEPQAQTVSADQRADAAQQQQVQPEVRSEQPEPGEDADEPQQQTVQQSEPEQSELAEQDEAQAQEQQDQAQADPETVTEVVLGGDRPARLLLPPREDPMEPRPLIVLMHGYSSFADQADQYFQFSSWVDAGGFGLLLPNGTQDRITLRFWNATPECCDIFGAEPDDVGYIKSLIEEARGHAAFDQVVAVGHSNGGFMAYRLACEEVPGLTTIVSLAGGAFAHPEDCRVPAPLSVLQIHGTADSTVLYEGGRLPDHPDPDRQAVPGAKDSVLRWAERAGCSIDDAQYFPKIDTDTAVEGAETSIVRFADRCAGGTVMELWKIEGGGHVPLVRETDFTPGILKWIAARYAPGDTWALETQERTIGGERSAQLQFPGGPDLGPIPLVVSLHGYGGQAERHDEYFGLSSRLRSYGFALITPQGGFDDRGNTFWNTAHPEDVTKTDGPDDYVWISGLVEEARGYVEVSDVFVVGYSNGGFMAYRIACDGLPGLTAIASLGGLSSSEPNHCADAAPISVLQIHDSGDSIIPYAGTMDDPNPDARYPGVADLISSWAVRADCSVQSLQGAQRLPAIDLDREIAGSETTVQRIREGCADGVTIEVWTVDGGGHSPAFQDDWPDRLVHWLLNESRAS